MLNFTDDIPVAVDISQAATANHRIASLSIDGQGGQGITFQWDRLLFGEEKEVGIRVVTGLVSEGKSL